MKKCPTCDRQFNEKHNICGSCRKWYITFTRKQELVKLLGGQCTKCGESDVTCLQFHHPKNNKQFNIARNFRIKMATLIKEAQKCILLCANCHQKHHRVIKRNVIQYYKTQQRKQLSNRLYICSKCGQPKKTKYSEMCQSCANSTNKKPKLSILQQDFKTLKYFTKVGVKYGVSDNAVRKWCKSYDWQP